MSAIPWPHIVDHDRKLVKIYVESGYPTTMGVPGVMNRTYPGYDYALVREDPTK